MVSKLLLRTLFAVLLLSLPQTVDAQFYQRKDSTAKVIMRGVKVERDVKEEQTDKGQKKRNTTKKRSKSSRKKDTVSKNDTVVKQKKRAEVLYDGPKYRLGDRVIMQGDSGNDVKSLAKLLVRKLYLDENDIIYATDGSVKYEGEIIRAVRTFQKVAGLHSDGMVGTTTLKALRKRK